MIPVTQDELRGSFIIYNVWSYAFTGSATASAVPSFL